MVSMKKTLASFMLFLLLGAAALGQVHVQPGGATVTPTVSPPAKAAKVHSLLPDLDIRADGEDANVLVQEGFNVRIDFSIVARGFTGKNVDVWVMMETGSGLFYTYDGKGPYMGWNTGMSSPYLTGPLNDMKSVVVLDYALPVGFYNAYVAIDKKPDGVLDPGAFTFMDMVDFEVFVMPGFFEDFEDGVADGWAPDGPHWTVTGGVYYLDCPAAGNSFSYYGLDQFGELTYSADMRMIDMGYVSDSVVRGLVFRTDGTPNNGYQAVMDNNGNVKLRVCINGPIPMLLASVPSKNAVTGAGNWNNLMVDARDSVIGVYVNGILEFTVDDLSHAGGYAGLIGEGSNQYDIRYEYDNAGLVQ
jgi:hypothetical protein